MPRTNLHYQVSRLSTKLQQLSQCGISAKVTHGPIEQNVKIGQHKQDPLIYDKSDIAM